MIWQEIFLENNSTPYLQITKCVTAGEQCLTERDVPQLARNGKVTTTKTESISGPSTVCRQIYKTQKLLAFDERGKLLVEYMSL